MPHYLHDFKETEMRVPCTFCKEPLSCNSRHNEHSSEPILGKVSHIFTSYGICLNCGGRSIYKYEGIPVNPPLEPIEKLLQSDLFTFCLPA